MSVKMARSAPSAAVRSAKIAASRPRRSVLPERGKSAKIHARSGFIWGIPANAVIDRLNQAINTGLADPKIKSRFADLGGTVLTGPPADFG